MALGAGIWLAAMASGQTTGPRNPPLVIASMVGRDLFEFYCASCHGRDGKGGGPVASALKTPPSDLTTLAHRNGGAYPRERVETFVTLGGAPPTRAHGSPDMPVWGPIFGGLEARDAATRIRIGNIVDYVASLQIR
jgi:mono/diheme cytochrome c family protein